MESTTKRIEVQKELFYYNQIKENLLVKLSQAITEDLSSSQLSLISQIVEVINQANKVIAQLTLLLQTKELPADINQKVVIEFFETLDHGFGITKEQFFYVKSGLRK